MGYSESAPERSVRSIGRAVVAAAAILIGNTTFGGDLYKWVDENGITHFSDQEPPSGQGHYKIIKGRDETPDAGADRSDVEAGSDTAAARGGMPDLYTKETYRRIVKARQETKGRPPGERSTVERHRVWVLDTQQVYLKAGLNYHAVIRAVADDLRNGRVRLPVDDVNVITDISLGLTGLRERAQRDGVNCLQFFSGETAHAVKYLWEAGGWREKESRGDRVETGKSARAGAGAPPLAQGRAAQPTRQPTAIVPDAGQAAFHRSYRLRSLLDSGDFKGAERLLGQGYDPNGLTPFENEGHPLLHVYCGTGKVETVRFLVEHGADVRRRSDKRKIAPLATAAAAGHRPVVEYLLSRGAGVDDQDAEGETALTHAASRGRGDVVKILVERGAEIRRKPRDGRTPLLKAAFAGHGAVVEYLLSKGADVNEQGHYRETALVYAVSRGWKVVMEILVGRGAAVDCRDHNGTPALVLAADRGWKEGVQILLARRADVNARSTGNGLTALLAVASSANTDIARMLIARGADVNAATPGGKSPLVLAVERNRPAMVRLLVENGARTAAPRLDETMLGFVRTGEAGVVARFLVNQCGGVNARTSMGSPLEIAAWSGRNDLFDALVASGGEVNARGESGWSPLMFAAAAGSEEAVNFLVAKGADPAARNDSGDTAAVLAAAGGHRELADMLETRGRAGGGKRTRAAPGKAARAPGNGIPAPFTVEAGERARKSLEVLLKETKADAMRPVPGTAMQSPTAGAAKAIEMNRAAYAKAGYDFDATIRAVANEFRRNSKPVDEFMSARSSNTPFLQVVLMVGVLAIESRIDCSAFFDAETAKAIELIRSTLLSADSARAR